MDTSTRTHAETEAQEARAREILGRFGLELRGATPGAAAGGAFLTQPTGPELISFDPTTGSELARVQTASAADYAAVSEATQTAFGRWRTVPAPVRGGVVRQLGDALRERKEDLSQLISLENGKILSEARGEVQEVIDVCDLAVGLSRQLYGNQMHSERPHHRLTETWHPLGMVGIISAFNFPVAVPGWGWALAAVCGDSILWKPSSLTPLISIAAQQVFHAVTAGTAAEGIFGLAIGPGSSVGEALLHDAGVPLVQATGSCSLGERVTAALGKRGARSILELGGNNGLIVLDDANLDLALAATVFGAVGTAGQRCTTTRRLILQRGIAGRFTERLLAAYRTVRIGDPLVDGTLMGPLVSEQAVTDYREGIERIRAEGGEVLCGDRVLDDRPGYFVEPTVVRSRADMPVVAEEIFAPILHVMTVDSFEEDVELNNAVPQGLSSSLFTTDLAFAERWLSAAGSDCGIANVNVGTSGAEIGGAFGGEKATGGGRQAGSDSWKAYMRRQTNTINYGSDLPLAQGVQFDLG
jgi:aldehyde dehydrogenase (NAD+)